jgi:5-methylcytosine-specific restriction endonuclease McrA
MPWRPPTPCLGCGRLTHSTRCPPCEYRRRGTTTARGLGWEHQQAAATVLANATHCWWCGQPPRPDDPLTADHLVPRARGGRSTEDNLVAAHRSCNSRRGKGGRGRDGSRGARS